MINGTIFTILFSISYIIGLSAHLMNAALIFAASMTAILIIGIFLNYINPKRAVVLFIAFIFGFFNMAYHTKNTDPLKGIFSNNVNLEGRVISIAQLSKEGTRAKFYIAVKNAKIKGTKYNTKNIKTLVSIDDKNKSFEKIQIGDTIMIKGSLRTPKPATNPSQFDYAKYLKYKDTFSILYSRGESFKVIKKADTLWWKLLAGFDTKRNEIISKHQKNIKSPKLEILGGIVFGNQAINPPDDVKQNFINSGLLHLLAASGLNVALIFGIWWFIADRVMRLPYALSISGGMFFVILYTFMTGFPPSILRASIMILFVLLGKLLDRSADTLALIFFVGFIMLVFDPKMFADVGFQLSFIVTIGLIISVEPLCSKLETQNSKFKEKFEKKPYFIQLLTSPFAPCAVMGAVLVPLVAQLYVMPLQMYYFNTLTPFSLIANLCVIPFVGAISFLGFISSILSIIPYLGDKIVIIFDFLASPLLGILLKISEYFSSLKYSILTMPSLSVFQMFLYWGILILLVANIKKNFSSKKYLIALIASILILLASHIQLPSKGLEIIAFDVDNADSFLIKTPKSRYILIDTGRLPYNGVSSAKMIINEYLKDKNIKELELLIITHFDNDHAGGAIDILKNFKVKRTIIQNTNPDSKTGEKILSLLKSGKYYTVVKNNEAIYRENDLIIKTYSANLSTKDIEKDKLDNENSIITYITSKDINALFMADSGVKGWEKVKDFIETVDILKVGHHGAKATINKDMLKRINPHYAIISVGYNKYGHPNFQTLDTLEKSGIDILSTRDLGAVKISKCNQHKTCLIENFDKKFVKTDLAKIRPSKSTDFINSDFIKKLFKELR